MLDVVVTKDGESPQTEKAVAEPVIEKKTPRFSLAQRRQEILGKLHLDLKVPRLSVDDDQGRVDVYVRYKPVESSAVERSLKRRGNDEYQQDEASLLFHADVLINSCIGVFYVLNEDMEKKYSFKLNEDGEFYQFPTETWTRFDPDLAKALGLNEYEASLATNIVRALYITDGDLIDASTELSTWSSKKNEKAAEDFTMP